MESKVREDRGKIVPLIVSSKPYSHVKECEIANTPYLKVVGIKVVRIP